VIVFFRTTQRLGRCDLTLQKVRPCYHIPFCLMKYLYMPYPDELGLSMGFGDSPQFSISTECKTKHTQSMHAQACGRPWHARTKGTHKPAMQVEQEHRLCCSCRTNRTGRHQLTGARNANEEDIACKHPPNKGTWRIVPAVTCLA